ncbi:MAG: hypothetical protein LAT61_13060 [Alcanivorax sp.]|nr:hypothetical protein [Alcanivorax sp.]
MGSGANAAQFIITTTEDASLPGECSLRDAFHAITHREEVNECPAGAGTDVIRLTAGERYYLDSQLVLGGFIREIPVEDADGEPVYVDGCDPESPPPGETCEQDVVEIPINPTLRIEARAPDTDEDPDETDELARPVIVAAPGERVIWVRSSANLTIDGITVRGCEPTDPDESTCDVPLAATADTPEDGGLLFLDGALVLRNGVRLEGGYARHGGAVFVNGSVPVTLQDIAITDNRAAGYGGAIAASETYGNVLQLIRFYIANNTAEGAEGGAGGIAMPIALRSPRLLLRNGTLHRNTSLTGGAALHVWLADIDEDEEEYGAPVLGFGNITVVENTSADSDAGGFFIEPVGGNDLLVNSMLVGNLPRDCAGAGLASGVVDGIMLAYTVTSDADCPLPAFEFPGNAGYSSSADIGVLRNADGVCAPGCEPLVPDTVFALPGFLPNFTASPVVNNLPAVVDAGSPVTSIQFSCESDDQRALRREDRCDIGAFEFRKAEGANDSFKLVIGETQILDVIANDLRDAEVDCDLLAPGTLCIEVVRPSDRGALIEAVIEDGYPTLRYTFNGLYDGYDYFDYRINRDAIVGATLGDNDIGARVAVEARPASGMTKSRNIDDFGGGGWLWLLLAGAGCLRRIRLRVGRPDGKRAPGGARSSVSSTGNSTGNVMARRLMSSVAVLMLCAGAQAAEIRVTHLGDSIPFPPRVEGECSLREAIYSAIDKLPNSTGCTNGQTGEDLIQLPEGTITLAGPLNVELNNRIVIQGEGPDKTFIDAGGLHRIISHRSRVVFRDLTLRGGNAGAQPGGAILAQTSLVLDNVRIENSQASAGGAIYLDFSADERRNVIIRNSVMLDNQSAGHGGALAMVAQQESHDIEISNSTFAGNSAGDAGGALDIRGFGQLRIINSTFFDNSAVQGGAALDLNDNAGSVNIISSTFLDNIGLAQIDLGELPDPVQDISVGNVTLSNSIYAGSTPDCSLADRRFQRSKYNLFADVIDPSCLTDSSSNMEENDTAPLADIRAALNGGVLKVPDELAEEDWFLPHLPVTDVDYVLIIDAANPATLVNGLGSADVCRATDLRGASRASGGACDRGAFEFQRPTAIDDQGNNGNRLTRSVRLDVLANDIAGEADMGFRRGTLTLQAGDGEDVADTIGEVFVRQRRRDPDNTDEPVLQYDDVTQQLADGSEFVHALDDVHNPDFECGIGQNIDDQDSINNDGAHPADHLDDDCIVVYRFRQPSPMVTCGDLPFKDRFRYSVDVDRFDTVVDPVTEEEERVWDNDPTTITGVVEVTINNVPPIVPRRAIERRINPGGDVTIHLLDEGVRESDFRIVTMRLSENRRPLFARRALDNSIEGTGVIFDLQDFTVTYRHGDNTKRFTDSFDVQLQDECGDTSMVRINITFPQQNASGGEMVGASGGLMMLASVLLMLRRRTRRAA